MSNAEKQPHHDDTPIRPHSFDGIQEYDKNLPTWWLMTFYGAILFLFVYWFFYHAFNTPDATRARLQKQLAGVELAKAVNSKDAFSDDLLWKWSQTPEVVATGKNLFMANCASCHGASLEGKIGPRLTDDKWIHGSQPSEIVNVIKDGVQAKGMPTWGPILGKQGIGQVAAFILSHHKPAAAPVESTNSVASGPSVTMR